MAAYHYHKFSAIQNCYIAACKDRIPLRAEEFARKNSIPWWYTSMDQLLADGHCNAISCAVVDALHASIAEQSLAAGCAVFCEKPMSRTLSEARSLVETAKTSGMPSLVNFSKQNNPALHALREVVASDMLGRLQSVEFSYLQGWTATGSWGDWRTTARWRWRLTPSVGTCGVVGDLGSHVVDAALFVFGSLQIQSVPSALDIFDAASMGLLQDFAPPKDFTEGKESSWVDVQAIGIVGSQVPCTIRISSIDQNAVDNFSILAHGSDADASLDLRKSKTSVFLHDHRSGEDREHPGPVVTSTYDRFIRSALLYATGSTAIEPNTSLDFHRGLQVMEILDSLAPGGLPV